MQSPQQGAEGAHRTLVQMVVLGVVVATTQVAQGAQVRLDRAVMVAPILGVLVEGAEGADQEELGVMVAQVLRATVDLALTRQSLVLLSATQVGEEVARTQVIQEAPQPAAEEQVPSEQEHPL